MVLQDKNVESYIDMDITEIDIYNRDEWAGQPADVRYAIQEKLDFRQGFAQQVSITRLDYMIRVLRHVFKKASISDPDAFKDKIK